jgi:alpha-L-arabinofuranosidase
VFVGEYASRSNTWWSALSEASYLTGVERNGDVVDMASYAPLLSNIDYTDIDLDGRRLERKGEVTTIACDPGCDNMLGEEQVAYPVTKSVRGLGNEFTYEFDPYSVTFITLHPKGHR